MQAAEDLEQVVDGARLASDDLGSGDVREVNVDQVQRQVVDDGLHVRDLVLGAGWIINDACQMRAIGHRHCQDSGWRLLVTMATRVF